MSARILGVTGSVGAGKSTVCRALLGVGWSVLDVDDAAADALLDALPEVSREVPAVVSSDGRISKGPLFAAMLGDPALRARIEALLRPHVWKRIRAWIQALRGPGAIDAALLFELELDAFCDATLCLQCPRDERRRRVQARSTASAKHFEAIESAQLPEREKARLSGAILETDAPIEAVHRRLALILEQLGFSSGS